MSTPASLRLYAVAMRLLAPLAPAVLRSRARQGKEDPARLAERLGRASVERPSGRLVWLHGVSVGESQSLLPLMQRFVRERPDVTLLATTGTVTAATLMRDRAPPGVIHQYAPIDTPGAIAAFLAHWRPDAGLFAESELWPNLILAAAARRIPLGLVSARITEKTVRGWKRAPAAAAALLQSFSLILAQDRASAARLASLGARTCGALNLKLAAPPLAFDSRALAALRAEAAGRSVILGASTHEGEEVLIAESIAAIASAGGRPLLVLAPRHPARGPQIAAMLRATGLRLAVRSAGEPLAVDTDVYLADTLGELGLLFGLADIAVIGGSFFGGVGGHNPLEAARLGAPAITGPDQANFADVYAEMIEAGAVLQANDGASLSVVIAALLADPARRRVMADAAAAYAERQAGELDRAWSQIAALVPTP